MKDEKTTQEQRKSITPYLKERFDIIIYLKNEYKENGWYMSMDNSIDDYRTEIKAFQQAQKEEIKSLERIHNELLYWECPVFILTKELIAKLKFESELK